MSISASRAARWHDQLLQVLSGYEEMLKSAGWKPIQVDPTVAYPYRATQLHHCLWLVDHIRSLLPGPEAVRLLGFLQGTLWSLGFFSIQEIDQVMNQAPIEEDSILTTELPNGDLRLDLQVQGMILASALIAPGTFEANSVLVELAAMRHKPEVPNQLFGYWFGPGTSIPNEPPSRPTGAILPRKDRPGCCLLLAPFQNWWTVLSERGCLSHGFGAGLVAGEVWRFVPVSSPKHPWPSVFYLSGPLIISPSDVESRYGVEAGYRVRADGSALEFSLGR
jgi:hypothetical protein